MLSTNVLSWTLSRKSSTCEISSGTSTPKRGVASIERQIFLNHDHGTRDTLGLGSGVLGSSSCVLGLGPWVLGLRRWGVLSFVLDFRPWSWVLGLGAWNVRPLLLGFWSWALGLGPWVLRLGPRVSGLRALGRAVLAIGRGGLVL